MKKGKSSSKLKNPYFSTRIQHGAKENRNHCLSSPWAVSMAQETCEFVGSYLLSKLTPVVGNNIGLYRDDGLAALNKTTREIENIKKTHLQNVQRAWLESDH